MNPFQLDPNPLTFNAISLAIVGLASLVYLLRLKEKSACTRLITLGLACFTAGRLAAALSCIVLWGGALVPLANACSTASLAAMAAFLYCYPSPSHGRAARLVRILVAAASLLALAFSLDYAYQILARRAFGLSRPAAFESLYPLTFLITWCASVHRTVSLQPGGFPSRRTAWKAYLHPQGRPARLVRNLSLALSIGLIQGVAHVGLVPPPAGLMLADLATLLMLAALVHLSFDVTAQQPGLVVRLVGLSLVILLAILDVTGLYQVNLTANWILERNRSMVAETQRALQQSAGLPDDLDGLPAGIVYLLARPQGDSPGADWRLVYARSPGFDARPLLQELRSAQLPPVWSYFLETYLSAGEASRPDAIYRRYGDHPAGSYAQYAAYRFEQAGVEYEAGLDLAGLSRFLQVQSASTTWIVLLGALFILFIFPLFFQTNLIRPLDRLLKGVRQADAGDLNIQVGVTHNDEVGYLATAFNKMIASLRQELDGRQNAEAELRQLNLTLEERVANRTRELEALYDVTAASSQAQDSQALFTALLERSLAALRTPLGFILLFEGYAGRQCLKLAAGQNVPPDWLPHFTASHTPGDWAAV
ncbi:MAG: HAMP domain-containing protein, partial [Chloroflexi bacterium]|nr:HAMP domain-containing protein [Chloroflexota bacterium]